MSVTQEPPGIPPGFERATDLDWAGWHYLIDVQTRIVYEDHGMTLIPVGRERPWPDRGNTMPALTESQRTGGHVLCDTCGGILYAEDAPRHSTHTKEEIAAVKLARRDVLTRREQDVLRRTGDEEAEAAEQAG